MVKEFYFAKKFSFYWGGLAWYVCKNVQASMTLELASDLWMHNNVFAIGNPQYLILTAS